MSVKEKRTIDLTVLIRLFLVGLDVVGLSLIGVTVSLISGTQIQSSSYTGQVIAYLQQSGFPNFYAVFGFGSVVFFLSKGILAMALNTFVLRRLAMIETEKSSSILSHYAAATLEETSRWTKKEISVGLTYSTEMTFSKLAMSLSIAAGEIALMVAVAIYLAATNALLFAFTAVYFALLLFAMQKFVGRRSKQAALGMQNSEIRASQNVFDLVDNYRQLWSLGKTSFLTKQFIVNREKFANYSSQITAISVLPRYLTEIALMFGFALLILQRVVLGPNSISASTIAVFVAASFRIIASLLPLQGAMALIKQIAGVSPMAFDLLETFFNRNEALAESKSMERPDSVQVSLRNVSYRYPGSDKDVLNGVDYDIQPGAYIAVTGESGSGKSTIADLLLGLRTPSSGKITINGLEPRLFVQRYPGTVSYLPQQTDLITGTLLENISLKSENTPQDVSNALSAIEKVGLGEWSEGLVNGLETQLTGENRGMSGGQLQRLGLARAIFGSPKLLILDEATSSLDSATEELVLESIDRLSTDMTVIAIAHRGNVISRAKTRIRIDQGKLT